MGRFSSFRGFGDDETYWLCVLKYKNEKSRAFVYLRTMITFEETGLKEEILLAISELGFVTPTPIQKKSLTHLLNEGGDLIATAQTGTGKTAAFGLPILHHTDTYSQKVQVLILAPTRELCVQIERDITTYSKYIKGLKTVAVYGGASIRDQMKKLAQTCQVVVGTPGRTLDLLKRKKLILKDLKWVVLDEADEMMSMGFKDELDAILSYAPQERQSLLFSATMPKTILALAKKHMQEPTEISVMHENVSAVNVSHAYYMVNARDRYLALKRIADMHPKIYAIIFCRTRRETKEIAESLSQDGYNADAMHGDLSQAQRDYVMNRFRKKQIQLLVATDVAARGIDVDDLTHVINYNLPDELETYVHRSGRTGRANKKGVSVSIIHSREKRKIFNIEKKIGKKMEHRLIPSGKEICEKQLFTLIDKVEKTEVDQAQIDEYLPTIYKKLDWLSREELIQRFVSVEFNRFLTYYKDSKDINYQTKKSDKSERKRGRKDQTFTKFFINVGSKDKVSPKVLIKIITEHMGNDVAIGKIDIQKPFSIFEIDDKHKAFVLKKFKKAKYQDIQLVVQYHQKKSSEVKEDRPFKRSKSKSSSRSKSKSSYKAKKAIGFRHDKKKKRKKRR